MIPPLLDQLLDSRYLALDLCAGTADEAIRNIVKLLWQIGEVRQPEQFYKAVMEREESSLTVAEGKIAFSACADRSRRRNRARNWPEQKRRHLSRARRFGAPNFPDRSATTARERLSDLRWRAGAFVEKGRNAGGANGRLNVG
jgi:hypothetical protein